MSSQLINNKRVYLDHAATTPPDPRVVDAMLPYLSTHWANPSSIYVEAQTTRRAIDQARQSIASLIGANTNEVVFTAGGSESDSLALRGVLAASKRRGNHLITSAVEHHAVLDTAEQLERDGDADVSIVTVNSQGQVDPSEVAASVREDTVLISVMHANNEIGAINNLAAIAHAARERNPQVVIHTDAVQSVAHLGVNVDELGIDLMTFTSHKIYGPRGAGALYVRSGTPLAPQTLGGGQEDRRRAGTEDTAAIVGFAAALNIASNERETNLTHERTLQRLLIEELPKRISLSGITGPTSLGDRLPGNVSALIGFVEGESILVALDLAGFAASSGSACTTGAIEPSHVLTAMGVPEELARGSLRFSFGHGNSADDVHRLLKELPLIVERLRELSPMATTAAPAHWQAWLQS